MIWRETPGMADLLLKNFSIGGIRRCHLRRSGRARRMRIELRPDSSLLIVVPRGTREDQWLAFVLGKRDWIIRSLADMRSSCPARPGVDTGLPAIIDLLYTGQALTVSYGQKSRKRLEAEDTGISIYTSGNHEQQASELLVSWLKARARDVFTDRLNTIASETGLEWNRLCIRGQRTRWGSCSAKKNISLNYKLLFLPAHLTDHVLLHELAHTRELNHSNRFWELMQRHDASCQEHRNELKLAGNLLPAWLQQIQELSRT
jgi:hypothetical protein